MRRAHGKLDARRSGNEVSLKTPLEISWEEALSKANVKAQVNSVVEHPKEGLKAHIITQENSENISKVLSPYTVGWELMK